MLRPLAENLKGPHMHGAKAAVMWIADLQTQKPSWYMHPTAVWKNSALLSASWLAFNLLRLQ